MANNDYLRQTLEHYRMQRQTQLDDLRKTEALIAHFERELGESPNSDASSQTTAPIDYGTVVDVRPSEPRAIEVRPDDFFGMTQTQATKAYLQRVKRAVSLDQIVEALRNGGAKLGGADPKKTLYVSLARNPKHEFVIPREGYFGLREFYPTLPKATTKAKNGRKARGARKHNQKPGPKKAKAQVASKEPSERPVKVAVHKVLSDGQARSLNEVVEATEKQLGRKIAKVGVGATLRGKEFVKEGDKYKLVK